MATLRSGVTFGTDHDPLESVLETTTKYISVLCLGTDMNRYFGDAWYHAKRAATNAYRGLREAGEPVERKVRELTGREVEEESTRAERAKERLEARLERVEERAEMRVRQAYEDARRRVRTVR